MSDFKVSNLKETENVTAGGDEPITAIANKSVVKISEETGIRKTDYHKEFGILGEVMFLPEDLTLAHLCMTAPDREAIVQNLGSEEFREGAVSLYNELAPRNAIEQMMATLAVAAWNATLTVIADGSRQDVPPEVRRLNLGLGFQGAGVATKALTTLQEMQSGSPKCVSVGNVNVEAGGQAIVGHVEAGKGPAKHRDQEQIRQGKKARRRG